MLLLQVFSRRLFRMLLNNINWAKSDVYGLLTHHFFFFELQPQTARCYYYYLLKLLYTSHIATAAHSHKRPKKNEII